MLLEKGMVSYWRSKPVMDFTVMGLVPMLPSTEVAPVLVMPDLVSRQKFSVVPRLMTARTGHGACGAIREIRFAVSVLLTAFDAAKRCGNLVFFASAVWVGRGRRW